MSSSSEKFLENHHALKDILTLHGSELVGDYVQHMIDMVSKTDLSYFDSRFDECMQVYRDIVAPIFGNDIAQLSIDTLFKNRLVSTADHQGVINHPFSVSSTYARTVCAKNTGQSCVITFPCASISLSNSSFPRGVFLHDQLDEEKKFYFKSLFHKLHPVYIEKSITKDSCQKIYDALFLVDLDTEKRRTLLTTFRDIFLKPDFFTLPDYDTQCTYGSFHLWKAIADFQNIHFVSFSQEKIVAELIIHKHLDHKTLIHALLFDPLYRNLYKEYFDGIQGAFSLSEKKGTHLFWGVVGDRRIALSLCGDNLLTSDGDVFVVLEENAIKHALSEKRIIPAMPLVFIVLSFYYGIVCGGGFSQVDYLGHMKTAWIRILRSMNQEDEATQVENIPTNIYLGDFAFIKNQNNVLMTSLDLLMTRETPSLRVKLFDAYSNLLNIFLKIHF